MLHSNWCIISPLSILQWHQQQSPSCDIYTCPVPSQHLQVRVSVPSPPNQAWVLHPSICFSGSCKVYPLEMRETHMLNFVPLPHLWKQDMVAVHFKMLSQSQHKVCILYHICTYTYSWSSLLYLLFVDEEEDGFIWICEENLNPKLRKSLMPLEYICWNTSWTPLSAWGLQMCSIQFSTKLQKLVPFTLLAKAMTDCAYFFTSLVHDTQWQLSRDP